VNYTTDSSRKQKQKTRPPFRDISTVLIYKLLPNIYRHRQEIFSTLFFTDSLELEDLRILILNTRTMGRAKTTN